MAKKASKKNVPRTGAGDRAGRTRSQAAPEQPAKVTLGGGRYNLVFRMPPELSAPPSDIARVLRRTAARIRKLTEYIRAVHAETEGGYYSHSLSSHSAARRLLTDIELGLKERNWDTEFGDRSAPEPGGVDHGEQWQTDVLNGELVCYTGEYDLDHPANAALVAVAFPPGSGLDAPNVVRPNRVHVYIRPDYPELEGWETRWSMLSIPLHAWFNPPAQELSVLAEADIKKLEAYAEWSERFAGHIEFLDGDTTAEPGRVLTENALRILRRYTHANDFTWVVWFETLYTFSKGNQAESVKVLWEHWERAGRLDGCGCSEKTIGEAIGTASDNFRLAHAFRDHAAWGTMIRPMESKGCFALFSPE